MHKWKLHNGFNFAFNASKNQKWQKQCLTAVKKQNSKIQIKLNIDLKNLW